MPNGVEETIAATGFAKALVTLRPEAAAGSGDALGNELGKYFDPINESQSRDLAASASRASSSRSKSFRPTHTPKLIQSTPKKP